MFWNIKLYIYNTNDKNPYGILLDFKNIFDFSIKINNSITNGLMQTCFSRSNKYFAATWNYLGLNSTKSNKFVKLKRPYET